MKFIALVSGGKDSCFNILHCLNAGHELVAMANLHPKTGKPDEIDSWMFQTVGHKAVGLLSQCAKVPLFRQELSEDEEAVVDELSELFTRIRSEIEFDGVSVGAIASTYQQLRVDKACAQQNLRSLCYLWQRDQRELLSEICRSGLDVRVIKVAGQGLNSHHLGRSLRDLEDELLDKHLRFGLHPCGEGGEYETMVFDAPFFKTDRMSITPASQKVVQHSTDNVYYLEFDVTKEAKTDQESGHSAGLNIPPLLSFEILRLLDQPIKPSTPHKSFAGPLEDHCEDNYTMFLTKGSLETCFRSVKEHLSRPQDLALTFHIIVNIKDMSRFAEMNAYYNEIFQQSVNKIEEVAPSRTCIEVAIPEDLQIIVMQSSKQDLSGKGLHVQGLSYWAPASIGPYSQCRLVNGISFVAGQIGLIPQTLELESDLKKQALLALQNAVKVLNVIHEFRDNWVPRLSIVYVTSTENAELAEFIWSKFSNFPLITVLVPGLPRGAKFEWSLQCSDLRYFAWFVPDTDEQEALYSAQPEVLVNNSEGYIHRSGFQVLQVSSKKLDHYDFMFSSRKSMGRNCVPVQTLHFKGKEVSEVYIKV